MKPAETKTKDERLAEALRANLRRRKAQPPVQSATPANSPKPTD